MLVLSGLNQLIGSLGWSLTQSQRHKLCFVLHCPLVVHLVMCALFDDFTLLGTHCEYWFVPPFASRTAL